MGGSLRPLGSWSLGTLPRPKRVVLAIAGAALLCIPGSQAAADPVVHGKPINGGKSPTAPITVTKYNDLRFGKLVMTSTSGSVVVPASGFPSYSGVVSIGELNSVGPARFDITGPPNRSIELQLTFPLTGTYGTDGTAKLDSLSVSPDFATGFSQSGTLIRLKLDGSGTNTITVGGKLTFLRDDASGSMNILFPISASVAQ